MSTLPPGPRRPSPLQLAAWMFRPWPFMESCARRFGDVFTVRFAGFEPYVFVTAPELVKTIFTADPAQLHAGEGNEVLAPVLGRWSVLLLDEAPHLRQRRLLLPPFHGERIAAYATVIRDATLDALARWPRERGRALALHPTMQSITLEVILRAVFGVTEGARLSELRRALVALIDETTSPLGMVRALQRDLPGSPWRRFLRLKAEADRVIYALIAERRAAGAGDGKDILSLLLAARDEEGRPMTDEELRDELVTLLLAGHETTATSLSWVVERLLVHPEVLGRVEAERARVIGDAAPAAEHLGRLEYLDAVCKETLRIRPILPIVARRVMKPLRLGAWEIPPGVTVAPCIWLVHRRPDLYPDPERFDPDRFVGKKVDPYAWFPFGGGTRRCIGMAFALYEMKVVLATLLGAVRLRLVHAGGEAVARRGITFAPRHGTKVVVDGWREPLVATRHAQG